MFSDTQDGANASIIINSPIETAKVNNVNPEKYLEYLLESRPSADWLDEQLDLLASWSETTREACAI
ncbi:transposase domain-containing protein [Pseudobutyrivibrio sp. ACV-2]|uniref:transposase domain-containing protein n=1 Tax=Pseudobutyrivibrio sp. ACV-2 TaxID=1520801 RepID=UPI00147AA24A